MYLYCFYIYKYNNNIFHVNGWNQLLYHKSILKTKHIHILNEKVMYENKNLLQVFNISVLNKTITMVQTASTTVNSLTQYNHLIITKTPVETTAILRAVFKTNKGRN